MIKKLLLFLLIFIHSFSFSQKSKTITYPTYDAVVEEFYNTYSSIDLHVDAEIKFEKKPDGWHVSTKEYNSYKTIEDILVWSKKENAFQKINIEKLSEQKKGSNNYETNRTRLKEALDMWGKRNFNFCPYYGYSGWDWDVIQDYQNRSNLPDSIYYGLGRAYSSYAANLLNNNTGYAANEHQFKLSAGQNCLTEEQLITFRKYVKLAIENFKKVQQLNPNFETIVGGIDTKISNEYLTSFLNLRIYQNEEEANKELAPNLYNDFCLSFAKNMLNSCDKNAILFTFGDGDTFPLLYVQSQYGFRKDVLVVNLSLLQTDRYINSLRNKILDAEPLPISFSADQISDTKREVILIEKEPDSATPVELSKMIEFISNDKNITGNSSLIPNYSYINATELQLTTSNGKLLFPAPKSYFTRSDLMVFDVLANTKLERPIYYAATSSGDSFHKLNNYLQLEGLVYHLNVSTKKQSDYLEFAEINTGVLYKNLTESFDWKGMSTVTPNERTLCYSYRKCFQDLITKLFLEEKSEYAEIVLDKYIETMPDNIMRYDLSTVTIIESYYKLKKIKKGNEIAKTLIYNIKHNINNYENITYSQGDPNWKKNTTEYLKAVLNMYDQRELLKELH